MFFHGKSGLERNKKTKDFNIYILIQKLMNIAVYNKKRICYEEKKL
jgi:hypothetical protein